MNDFDDLGIVDSSWLTDADWAVINRLRRIHETEGQIAVRKALRALEPESYLRVAAAFLPDNRRQGSRAAHTHSLPVHLNRDMFCS
jgi:hypothetical protein